MANIQIPNLPAVIALNGLEQLEIVQDGVSGRTTTQAIANLSAIYYQPQLAAISSLQGNVSTLQGDVSTLQGDVSTLQGDVSTLQGDVSTLQSSVSTLQTNVSNLQNVPCASYFSSVTQNHGAIGNEGIVSCNNTDFEYGITLVSGNRFTAGVSGIYNFQFSLQLVSAVNNKQAHVWLKKDGATMANSNTEIDLPNKDNGYVAAWNFLVPLNAGQYLQLAWTSNDSVNIKANSTPTYGPAIPSVIVTMNLIRRT